LFLYCYYKYRNASTGCQERGEHKRIRSLWRGRDAQGSRDPEGPGTIAPSHGEEFIGEQSILSGQRFGDIDL